MKQFVEWQRFDEISPFGDLRGDWQAAAVCATVANAMSRKKFNVSDFLLTFEKEARKAARAPKQSSKEMRFLAQMLTAAFAEKPKRKINGR